MGKEEGKSNLEHLGCYTRGEEGTIQEESHVSGKRDGDGGGG